MSKPQNRKSFDTPYGQVECYRIILSDRCAHCETIIAQKATCLYFSEPYHIMLHERCAPFYNYNKIYPHEKLMIMYNQ